MRRRNTGFQQGFFGWTMPTYNVARGVNMLDICAHCIIGLDAITVEFNTGILEAQINIRRTTSAE